MQTRGEKAPDCADTDCGTWSYLREYFVQLPILYDINKAFPLVFEGTNCGSKGNQLYALPNLASSVIRVGVSPSVDAQAFHSIVPGGGCLDEHEGDDSIEWVFYENLYDQLAGQFCFDRNRVFVSGDQGSNGGGFWANELGCKYAGDPTRPIRGVLSNNGGLLTDPKYVPTCTSSPLAGMWSFATSGIAAHSVSVAIGRAMKVNGCTIGTGFADAMFESFPIGGANPDGTCKKIMGCPALTPLVVCPIVGTVVAAQENLVNPGWPTFLSLFEAPPLLNP
jgi:hypothetical protein